MADKYYVIISSEDGEPSVKEMTKEQVLKMFVPNEYGDYYYGKREALSELPGDISNFDGVVIIKGEIVVPKPRKVVTEYEL